jgi:hypothetical protein
MSDSMPTVLPPDESLTASGDATSPSDEFLSDEEDLAAASGMSEPSFNADDSELAGEAAAAGAWHNNKKITQLWTINENRNSWAAVSGLGWRKISPSSDSVNTTLTMLAAHAKQTNRTVRVREESNTIVEMYVW